MKRLKSEISSIWKIHARSPNLVNVGGTIWLISQELDAGPTSQIAARDTLTGETLGISHDRIDSTCCEAINLGHTALIIWPQLVNGIYQLFDATLDERIPRQVTASETPIIAPRVASNLEGASAVVYQSNDTDGYLHIFARLRYKGVWSSPIRLENLPGNQWAPDICVDCNGQFHIVWDGYGNGSYDIYYCSLSSVGGTGNLMRLTDDDLFHTHPSIAAAENGGLWVAWNYGTSEWGKSNQPYRSGRLTEHNYLHARRFLKVVQLRDNRIYPVAPEIQCDFLDVAMPGQHHERPRLFPIPNGPLYLTFRYNAGEPRGGHRKDKRWEAVTIAYDGQKWTDIIDLLDAHGLSTGGTTMLPLPNGELALAAAGEGGSANETFLETTTRFYVQKPKALSLHWNAPPIFEKVYSPPTKKQEKSHKTLQIEGEKFNLYMGDLHRHTEFSFCRCCLDGSLEEVYRYLRDAAKMDFGASTDHDFQIRSPDMWHEIMRTTDLYNSPHHFSALFGYEWIGSIDNRRHRNVVSADRLPPPPSTYFTEAGMEHRSIETLWGTLPRRRAITIPHHPACGMSLIWLDDPGESFDEEMEPLVEIFQGSRGSSEYVDAPTLYTHFVSSGHYKHSFNIKNGTVATALKKGLRMGFIASSDHMSTHQSYACVYARENTRESLIEAMIARRVYAASAPIFCDFRINEAFMGASLIQANCQQDLNVHIHFCGTARIREVVLMRDSHPFRRWKPESNEITISDTLNATQYNGHYFYVRMQQEDTHLAWSSPIWINYPSPELPQESDK